jgi:hypothetical protein
LDVRAINFTCDSKGLHGWTDLVIEKFVSLSTIGAREDNLSKNGASGGGFFLRRVQLKSIVLLECYIDFSSVN